ncbi:hypothetical protein SRABI118_01563 [Massilia sp. Bi118]|uniref:hypothetical protein n=1 Tax=Massilia sp. Bi118 TaxID=2822346 RepID=UPI001E053F7B|nr:hypothetical protein [Massilia sp. Bi118]CAH0193725.1 hypothetical protein SRABI118_01563 [Massilia sp. Bi118]
MRVGVAAVLKRAVFFSAAAGSLTYLSLLVPGQVIAVCGNLGVPVYCPVLAYGFPLPFLADSQATSPTGSVARDPLSLLIGQDDLLWGPLALSAAFWLLLVLGASRAWRRHAGRR